jgi:hypothetical protein
MHEIKNVTNYETVTQSLIILLTYLDFRPKVKLYQRMNPGRNVILRKKKNYGL